MEKITVYSKPHCPACRMTWNYLNKMAKHYQIQDKINLVKESAVEHRDFLRSRGATAAPVTVFPSGEMVFGFTPEKITDEMKAISDRVH